MPDCADVAAFIDDNKGLGAYRGLEQLGFSMNSPSATRAAFTAVHTHLENHLTEADKVILGFSPIFTEHLLCKVVRWERFLNNEANLSFDVVSTEAENMAGNWQPGLNATDHLAFPFPLVLMPEDIERAIKECSVCTQVSSPLASH
jgi:hypothetical protein